MTHFTQLLVTWYLFMIFVKHDFETFFSLLQKLHTTIFARHNFNLIFIIHTIGSQTYTTRKPKTTWCNYAGPVPDGK